MKSHIWVPYIMIFTVALFTGCSDSDSTPTPGFTGGGAKTTDSFTPKSADELTSEEAGLVSAGESEPDARIQRPQG